MIELLITISKLQDNQKREGNKYLSSLDKGFIGKVGLYKIQNYLRILGKDNEKWQVDEEVEVPSSIVLVSGAKHYSIPKSFSILGLGD